ncbi:sugar ABC transporter substrate-binding protein [Lentibacter algarum]|uniref:sugar ABC transporter substrate-binding protein n=1 Tax=Lentibacter algarum TaxID=576131 RepID=UPI001C074625|nr:sugar ABC transporter substrate-binding protein [Lentibacter algarum]MBU2980181.1 sugar ABC transporter substrate-binding protein [Lentibacter algarum]
MRNSLLGGVVMVASLVAGTVFATNPAVAEERFVFVSHAPDSDSWWNVVKNALKNAEKDQGVKVEYRNPPTGDLADMARIIQQATATNPDGIVTTIADFDVLQSAIQGAVAKGIPVITVNSGTAEQAKELGAFMRIGLPDYDAGKAIGERAKAAEVTKFLCVNHYITSAASVERCQGYADGLGVELGGQMIDSGSDPTLVYNKVKAYLSVNPDTDGILLLGPNGADPVIRYLRDTGSRSKFKSIITFNLDGDINEAIKDGTIDSAIDQQPYLQGYLPIVFLTQYVRYGVMPVNNEISTGPSFVTKENIGLVEKLAGEYR